MVLSDNVGRWLAITSTNIVAVICRFKWLIEVKEGTLFFKTDIFIGLSKVSYLCLKFSLYSFETFVVMSLLNLIHSVLDFVINLKQNFALKGNWLVLVVKSGVLVVSWLYSWIVLLVLFLLRFLRWVWGEKLFKLVFGAFFYGLCQQIWEFYLV